MVTNFEGKVYLHVLIAATIAVDVIIIYAIYRLFN